MTIRVSDQGITRLDQYGSENSKTGYVSLTDRLKNKSVEKTDKTSAASHGQSVVREAEENFVLGSTPAYTVKFSSEGMTALKGLKILREQLESYEVEDVKKDEVPEENKESINSKNNESTAADTKVYTREPNNVSKLNQDKPLYNNLGVNRGSDKSNVTHMPERHDRQQTKVVNHTEKQVHSVMGTQKQKQAIKAYEYQMKK